MNFGISPELDKLFFEELEALPLQEQNERLKVELEAVACDLYVTLQRIQLLESHISKLSDLNAAALHI